MMTRKTVGICVGLSGQIDWINMQAPLDCMVVLERCCANEPTGVCSRRAAAIKTNGSNRGTKEYCSCSKVEFGRKGDSGSLIYTYYDDDDDGEILQFVGIFRGTSETGERIVHFATPFCNLFDVLGTKLDFCESCTAYVDSSSMNRKVEFRTFQGDCESQHPVHIL